MVSPELFHCCPCLGSLTNSHQKAIAALAEEVSYEKGEAIFHEGQPAEALYLLLEGDVELYHHVREEASARSAELMVQLMDGEADMPLVEEQATLSREFLVGSINPGEIAALSALITPHRLTATARAAAPCRLIRIEAAALDKLCTEDPWLSAGLMRAVAKTAMDRLHFTRTQLTAINIP